jgi:antitoxin CptB
MAGEENHDQDGDQAARVRRLRFRAWRRGFKEADLLLGLFADAHAAEMTPDELEQFEALLEEADHDIYAWTLGAAPPPARHDHALLARLQAFCREELSAQNPSGS